MAWQCHNKFRAMNKSYSPRGLLPLQWRNYECNGVSNHRRLDRLLNCLLRHRLMKTSKLRVTGLCVGIHRWLVDSPHKWPVTQKCFQLMTSSITMNSTSIGITKWISNYIHINQCDAITHQCPYFNSGFVKLLLEIGYGRVITSNKWWLM